LAGEEAAEVVQFAEVPIEVAVEVDEEGGGGEGFLEDDLGVFGFHGFGGEGGDDGRDDFGQLFEASREAGSGEAAGGEFGVAIAGEGDAAEEAADVFAEIAFEVEGQRSGGVCDAGGCLPEHFVGREGFDLANEARKITVVELGELGLGSAHGRPFRKKGLERAARRTRTRRSAAACAGGRGVYHRMR